MSELSLLIKKDVQQPTQEEHLNMLKDFCVSVGMALPTDAQILSEVENGEVVRLIITKPGKLGVTQTH